MDWIINYVQKPRCRDKLYLSVRDVTSRNWPSPSNRNQLTHSDGNIGHSRVKMNRNLSSTCSQTLTIIFAFKQIYYLLLLAKILYEI